MSFQVLGHLESGIARVGRLIIPERRPLETPNVIAITSRGTVPHMTPDVINANSQIGGVHMALEDYTERAVKGTPPILNSTGLHAFTALPHHLITILAPRRTPAVTPPQGNTNNSISIYTSTGFQVLTNEAYIKACQALRPDIALPLADISHGAVPGTKRVAKMSDRSEEWLTQLIAAKQPEQAIFAPILAIDFHSQSEYIDHLADDLIDDISGLAFYDSNLLPDIPATTALSILPRLSLDEPASPHHILRQISLGMDIFCIPFIGFATDAGIALSFEFPEPSSPPFEEDKPLTDETGTQTLPLGINMWTANHATSIHPLLPSCTCYTCTSHHRAYISHLLSAKEMLGWVLLQIHNHHVISSFFHSIRQSIERGTFESDREIFARVYEAEMPEKSGQGPRARGYHFKSEGPGEMRKNEPARRLLDGDEERGGGLDEALVPDVEAEALEGKGFAEKVER